MQKRVTISIDEELHKESKRYCVEKDINFSQMISEGLKSILNNYKEEKKDLLNSIKTAVKQEVNNANRKRNPKN